MIKIETKIGNLLNVKTGHLVHGCNAQGIMGSGVAVAVKNTYPEAYRNYRDFFDVEGLILGRAYPVEVSLQLVVWNAITQNNFGSATRMVSYDAIETCFRQINQNINDRLDRFRSGDLQYF